MLADTLRTVEPSFQGPAPEPWPNAQIRAPWLAVMIGQWAMLILMPTLLLLIAVLALVTRWWDQRDEPQRCRRVTGVQPDPPPG